MTVVLGDALVRIGADTSRIEPDLKGKLARINAAVDVAAKLDSTQFSTQMSALKAQLKTIGVTKARVDADTAAANAEFKALKLELDQLDTQVKVDGSTDELTSKIAAVKAQIASISKARVKLDVDSAAATAQMKAVQAQVADLDGRKVNIDVDIDQDHLNLANKGVSTLMASFLALAPAAVPVLAATAGGVGALGAGLLAAGGAGGIFAASVVGVVTQMKAGQEAIGQLSDKLATQKKGSEEYAATLDQLQRAQRNFTAEFGPAAAGLDQVKSAWSGFMAATKGTTVQVIGAALSTAAGVLRQIAPVANAAGGAVRGLIGDFAAFSKGPGMRSILSFFRTEGPGYITSFGRIAGSVLLGVFNLFRAFAPLTGSVVGGLERMTAAFARWSAGLSGNSGFQSFLAYVQQAMPQVAALVGNLIGVFAHLVAAMAPLGGVVLGALNGIAGAIRAIPVPVLTGLIAAVAAFGAAVTVANLAISIWTAVSKIALVATKAWAAGQWLLNAAMRANPIGLVVVAIAGLVAGLIIAYKHSETFRNIVQGAFQVVRSVVASVIGWFGRYVPQVFGAVVAAVRSYLTVYRTIITTVFRAALAVVRAVLTALRAVVTTNWRGVVTVVRALLAAHRAVVNAVFRAVLSIVRSVLTSLRAAVSVAWRAIVALVRSSLASYRALVTTGFRAVLAVVRSVLASTRSVVTAGWRAMNSAVRSAVSAVRSAVSSGFSAARSAVSSAMSAARSAVSSAMGAIRGAVSAGVGAVVGVFKSLGGRIRGAVGGLAGALRSAGVNMIQGLMAGIRSMAGAAASAAAGVVRNAISAAWAAVRPGSPSREFRPIGVNAGQGLEAGFVDMRQPVAAAARSVVDGALRAVQRSGHHKKMHKFGKATILNYVNALSDSPSRKAVDTAIEKVFAGIRRYGKAHDWTSKHIRKSIKDLSDEAKALRNNADRRDALNAKLRATRQIGRDIASSLVQESNLGTIEAPEEGQTLTTAGIVQTMKDRLKAVQTFAANINKLRKKGLSAQALQDIAGAGVEAGGATAAALAAATPAQIKALNRANKGIADAATGLGRSAVSGLVKGLTEQLADVDAAGVRIARRLRDAIRRELKIKSPSRRLREDGRNTALGLVKGVLDGTPAAEAAAAQMAARVRTAAQFRFDAMSGPRIRTTGTTRGALSSPRPVVTAGQDPDQALTAAITRLIALLERRGPGNSAPLIGSAVIRENVDLDRYEQQRAFRERATNVSGG